MIPNKTTPTDYEILDLIKERWSPRVFSEEIPKEEEALGYYLWYKRYSNV